MLSFAIINFYNDFDTIDQLYKIVTMRNKSVWWFVLIQMISELVKEIN